MAYSRNRKFGYTPYVGSVTTLNPTEDLRVNESSPTTNYETETTSALRYHASGFARHIYQKFDLTGIRDIDKATLRLYIKGGPTNTNSIVIHEASNTSWDVTTMTWNTAVGFVAGTLAAEYVTAIGAYLEFDVTSYVSENYNKVISFAIRPSPETQQSYDVDMSEGINPPELVIEHGGATGALPIKPIRPNMYGWGVNFSAANWDVYEVSNNAASGAGSLADAISQPNRVIIFSIGGVFPMGTTNSYHSNMIIAGQTAPDSVIIDGDFTELHGSNVLIQHVTIWASATAVDGIAYGDQSDSLHQHNIVMDHCAILYGRDECVDIWNKLVNSEFHYESCFIGPAGTDINTAGGRGALTGGDVDAYMKISYKNCVFNSVYERMPRATSEYITIMNCLGFNWGDLGVYISQREISHLTYTNVIDCLFETGLDTTSPDPIRLDDNSWEVGSQVYLEGNTLDTVLPADQWDNVNLLTVAQVTAESATPINVPPKMVSAGTAGLRAALLAGVGPRPTDRYPELQALIDGVDLGTGRFHTAGGGVPPAVPVVASTGIVLSPPSNTIIAASGYTLLEEWLHAQADAIE